MAAGKGVRGMYHTTTAYLIGYNGSNEAINGKINRTANWFTL